MQSGTAPSFVADHERKAAAVRIPDLQAIDNAAELHEQHNPCVPLFIPTILPIPSSAIKTHKKSGGLEMVHRTILQI